MKSNCYIVKVCGLYQKNSKPTIRITECKLEVEAEDIVSAANKTAEYFGPLVNVEVEAVGKTDWYQF